MPAKTAVKMSLKDVMAELKKLGNEQQKKTYFRHGVREPVYGVKIADLKVIQKKVKKDYELSLQLYDTGNSDAMYLAGSDRRSRPDDEGRPQEVGEGRVLEHDRGLHRAVGGIGIALRPGTRAGMDGLGR